MKDIDILVINLKEITNIAESLYNCIEYNVKPSKQTLKNWGKRIYKVKEQIEENQIKQILERLGYYE